MGQLPPCEQWFEDPETAQTITEEGRGSNASGLQVQLAAPSSEQTQGNQKT